MWSKCRSLITQNPFKTLCLSVWSARSSNACRFGDLIGLFLMVRPTPVNSSLKRRGRLPSPMLPSACGRPSFGVRGCTRNAQGWRFRLRASLVLSRSASGRVGLIVAALCAEYYATSMGPYRVPSDAPRLYDRCGGRSDLSLVAWGSACDKVSPFLPIVKELPCSPTTSPWGLPRFCRRRLKLGGQKGGYFTTGGGEGTVSSE
jgi:hypothetical protein